MVQLYKTEGRILMIISVHKVGVVHINRCNWFNVLSINSYDFNCTGHPFQSNYQAPLN